MLYNMEGDLPTDVSSVDIEHAKVRRAGKDVSLIAYGGSLFKTLQAADTVAKEGVDAEVLNLRTLRPVDTNSIFSSVAKTRRCVIIDEGAKHGNTANAHSATVNSMPDMR